MLLDQRVDASGGELLPRVRVELRGQSHDRVVDACLDQRFHVGQHGQTARDAVRKYARTLENAVAWFGPQAWLDFTLNAEVRTLVQYTSGANPSNFAIKATIQPDLISAILGIPVVIGNMGKATSAATDPTTDVWTDSAGIVLTGGNDAFGMRFALNVMAQGFPATTQWFDEDYGAKGANKVKQADSWKLTVVKNTAAYLISDTNQ